MLLLQFNRDEAAVISGQSRTLNDGWKLETINGNEDVTLPRTLSGEGDYVVRSILKPIYSGLTMEFPVNNAGIVVFVNENKIFENETTEKEQNNRFTLPKFDNTAEIKIEIIPDQADTTAFLKGAVIYRSDATVIQQLKDSLIQIHGCIILLFCVAILTILEIMRRHSGWEEEHLFRLALFGIFTLIYCICETQFPEMIFGNEAFFQTLQVSTLSILPMLLLFYAGNTWLPEHAQKPITILTTLVGITGLFLNIVWNVNIPQLQLVPYIVLFLVVAVICILICCFKGRYWGVDLTEYLFFAGFCFVGILEQLGLQTPAGLKNLFLTLAMATFSAYQTAKLVSDYRGTVESSRQEAIRANHAKSEFLARMSHEIRTPINAVLGMDEMILRESSDTAILDYAMDIQSAGRILLSLINDILDLSKIETGKMEIIQSDYDVCSMIHDTVNMIQPRAKEKGLELKIKVSPNLPSRLYGDETRIRQVLTNLLTNAVKYTEKGSVGLSVTWDQNKRGEGVLHCKVWDTGIGIKEEELPKLFRAYERIEEEKHRQEGGTGLGMNVSMRMLKLMGCKLKVKSQYGKGSKFWFDLKQKVTNPETVGDFELRLKTMQGEYAYRQLLCAPDAKVLVVDDNDMNRKVFRSLLKETGIKVTEAASGAECLELVQKHRYHMIFLDHMMPDMDGIETLHEMRSMTTKCENVPVYILTANAIAGAKEQYLAEGFDGFLSKPIDPERLEKAIKNNIPKKLLQKKILPKKEEKETGNIPEIDGMDPGYAMAHFPDSKMLYAAMKEFYKGADSNIKKADALYSQISLENILQEYRIVVHAMKSSSATIGVAQLSGMAKILEQAAIQGNIPLIQEAHPMFSKEWRDFQQRLGEALGLNRANKKKVGNDVVIALVSMIEEAIRQMDVDRADETVQKLNSYRFDSNLQVLVDEITNAVSDLDEDATINAANQIRQCISGHYEGKLAK